MHPLPALAVVAFAVAAMFIMVTAATETNAARSPATGSIIFALPPGMAPVDLPE